MTKAQLIARIAPETMAVKAGVVTVDQMAKTLSRETKPWLEAKLAVMMAPTPEARKIALAGFPTRRPRRNRDGF